MTPTREEAKTLVAHNKSLIDRNVTLAAENAALRERLEAAEAAKFRVVTERNAMEAALTEARAQVAAAWEAGRDAAAKTAIPADRSANPSEYEAGARHAAWSINARIERLTPPTDATAALTARLDAEWNSAMEKTAQIAQGNGAYATAHAIRAHRRKVTS